MGPFAMIASVRGATSVTRSVAHSTIETITGSAGWPPGLYVFDNFGTPTSAVAKGVLNGACELIQEVNDVASGNTRNSRMAMIPQPKEGRISKAHNLAMERKFVSLNVRDPAANGEFRKCEHFSEYGSKYHSLTYFRGNENLPRVLDPILAELRNLDVVKNLSKSTTGDGDAIGLHWKLTLNDYKRREAGDSDSLAEAGGALFPWHTDLAANGEITAIATLLAPAVLEFAPYSDLGAADWPTRIVAKPGSLVLLSGEARWKWVHRAVPHPDATDKARISLVLGCASRKITHS